ncbi:GlsB/YeaQ/YmgE family stress response membrane protein [Enterococcus alcedinis]|uniref:Membrane protein n=1 Tax=Enterococcus alcedinis TaxID=1274384 RepID=A0A917JEQ2_9ENTE|nr:GlsB/YeaQ/YmgE family stress response membrane protein [Enterococcus alcedinis]MBP2102286.1 putative membrane protein YeaQ/YmgE (transglycosylase-associated protein family) [Enterococcus alcedinis]GGI65845.1 membrane protein [Enterococcus alcedinis]
MSWLWTMIAGAIIGMIAGMVTGEKRGCIFNIIAGIIGSSIGERLFSSWGGPKLGGMYLLPSVVGAIIFVAIVSFFFGRKSQ